MRLLPPKPPKLYKARPERARRIGQVLPPRLPGLDIARPLSVADYLSQGPSKFGGTNLERLVDNAAGELGFSFDAAQHVVHITTTGYYTIIDRVIANPPTAVYIDGIDHELRLENQQTDLLQDIALRDLGWRVFRLSYKDLLRDPVNTVRHVLWGVG